MTRYIKGKDGKFAGSIGEGRDHVPAPAVVASPDLTTEAMPHAPTLAQALASMRIPTPTVQPGRYVLEVFTDPRADLELDDAYQVSIYGPLRDHEVADFMDAFPASEDLYDMYAVSAEDLEEHLRHWGAYRAGQPVWVNDPTRTTETDDRGLVTDGFTEGSLQDLPGNTRHATVRANGDVVAMTTTVTDRLAPTDTERSIVATAVDDWFARIDADRAAGRGGVAVWQNDRTGVWQVVDVEGIQYVWVGKRFDYCTEFTATPDALTFTLGSETLTAARVTGVDPMTFSLALQVVEPRTQDEFDLMVASLQELTVDRQVAHYVSSAGQRSLAARLRHAVGRR